MKWTLLNKSADNPKKIWLKCECGTEKLVEKRDYLRGKSSSCGCARKESSREKKTEVTTEIGTKINLLTYLGISPSICLRSRGVFLCDCGTKKSMSFSEVRYGKTKSCGCLHLTRVVTHGLSRSRPYKIWQAMVNRCTNVNDISYENYGSRGITVCDRWLDFTNFWEDVEDIYQDDLTIERIENNKGYYLENVRFATKKEQALNRRNKLGASGFKGVFKTKSGYGISFKYGVGEVYNKKGLSSLTDAINHYHQKYIELTGTQPNYQTMP